MDWMIVPKDSDITHHGVEGQKHGIRNGPPYPLGMSKSEYKKVQRQNAKAGRAIKRADKKAKKIEKKRQKAINSKNPYQKLYDMKDQLTYSQLSDALNRIDLEQKIYARGNPPKKGFKYYADKAVKGARMLNDWYSTGSKVWDNFKDACDRIDKKGKYDPNKQNNDNGGGKNKNKFNNTGGDVYIDQYNVFKYGNGKKGGKGGKGGKGH